VLIHVHKSVLNYGKGAAVRTGLRLAKGEILLIQDGDLEYDPKDYPVLLAPFEDASVHVVYGSRFFYHNPKGMKFLNLLANRILAFLTTILFSQKLTDEATGYKVFRRDVLNGMELKSRGFEFCPEFTGKCLRFGYKIKEVPISYNPRGILEGKKIKAKDGFIAVWWLLKARFSALTPKTKEKSIEKFAG
jgi:glycosyltransferase involved in cell wall biosynthesis